MNPSAFASSIKTADARSALIGFEFEFCIPNPDRNKVTDEWIWEFIQKSNPESWDRILTVRGVNYSLFDIYQKGYISFFEESIIPFIENALSDDQRNQLMSNVDMSNPDPYYSCTEVVEYIADHITDEIPSRRKMAHIKVGVDALGLGLGWPELVKQVKAVDEEAFIKEAKKQGIIQPGVRAMRQYAGASIQPAIEQAFGSAVVFNAYHEAPKDLTKWYIEPDSSIRPNDSDSSAEVVSPPMKVTQALGALKTFYALAKQHGWYTSAQNATGLHINISIPGDLDVLKLALIVGDYHVLTKFDRQVSVYAKSIYRAMTGNDASVAHRVHPEPAKLRAHMLQKLAQEFASDHYSSISIGGDGKYISFRHVGGDYLHDLNQITPIIGRFVRGMVIASDPNLYRNEYLTKLAKAVGAFSSTTDPLADKVPGVYGRPQNS